MPRLIFTLTAGILFAHGLMIAYQSSLRRVLGHTFFLSSFEWLAYAGGLFLLEPVLLFVALYSVRSRRELSLSLTALLPGLVVAVVVGNSLGQFVGKDLWNVSRTAIPVARTSILLVPRWPTVLIWIKIIEPLAHGFMTAVAALGLAQVRNSKM